MKISIVTPTYNSDRFLRETIESVISQTGKFFIEYIIIDNCSTDGTIELIEEYKKLIDDGCIMLGCEGINFIYVSEKDGGMYDAINKGFDFATGEIYAWLNADDVYLPGALSTITKVFRKYDDIHWLKGITSYITNNTSIWKVGKCFTYNRKWILSGIYGRDLYFIQQDSVFWRSWLWKKVGGIDNKIKRAGDYYLWMKFAQSASLISVSTLISCFRTVEGQISQDFAAYMKEVYSLSPGNNFISKKVQIYCALKNKLPGFIRLSLYRLLFGKNSCEIIRIQKNGDIIREATEHYKYM